MIAGLLLAICNAAALADPTVAPPPPRPDFAVANPGWIYNAQANCWALDNSHELYANFTWTGRCKHFQIAGKGALVWSYGLVGSYGNSSPANRTITGTFSDGALNGRGRVDWKNGAFSEGGFSNGELNGAGTQNWSSGNRYEGEFRDGKPDGRGRYDYADGSSYDGEFEDGIRQGHGKWTFAGGVYEGEFLDGEISGHGVLRRPDGTKLEGEAEPARNVVTNPPPPMYPPLSRRLNEEGSVEVVFTVLADGRTDNVKTALSSTYTRLDTDAVNTVTNWRFTPARLGGIAIAMPKTQMFSFQLED